MNNIHTFNRRLLSTLFVGCAIIALMIGPVLAQAVKPRQAKTPATAQQGAQPKRVDVTVDDLEQKAYRKWLTYYRRQQQGEQLPLPTFTIPSDVPPTEAKQARQIWQKASGKHNSTSSKFRLAQSN